VRRTRSPPSRSSRSPSSSTGSPAASWGRVSPRARCDPPPAAGDGCCLAVRRALVVVVLPATPRPVGVIPESPDASSPGGRRLGGGVVGAGPRNRPEPGRLPVDRIGGGERLLFGEERRDRVLLELGGPGGTHRAAAGQVVVAARGRGGFPLPEDGLLPSAASRMASMSSDLRIRVGAFTPIAPAMACSSSPVFAVEHRAVELLGAHSPSSPCRSGISSGTAGRRGPPGAGGGSGGSPGIARGETAARFGGRTPERTPTPRSGERQGRCCRSERGGEHRQYTETSPARQDRAAPVG